VFLYFLYTVHVMTCIFLILVVLLQRGKGADLSVFGGGATQSAFGARGTATLLHKLTVGFFVGFIVTTLSIAMVQSRSHGTTVLSGLDDKAEAAETAAADDEATTEDAAATSDAAEQDTAAQDAAGGESADAVTVAGEGAESAPTEAASSGDDAGEAGTGDSEESP